MSTEAKPKNAYRRRTKPKGLHDEAIIDQRQREGKRLVRRLWAFRPGPADPEPCRENQWFYEVAYRFWLWPRVLRGHQRDHRTVTFHDGLVMVTVVDVRMDVGAE